MKMKIKKKKKNEINYILYVSFNVRAEFRLFAPISSTSNILVKIDFKHIKSSSGNKARVIEKCVRRVNPPKTVKMTSTEQ